VAALPKIRGLGMTLDAHWVFPFSLAQSATKILLIPDSWHLIPDPLIPVIRSLICDALHQKFYDRRAAPALLIWRGRWVFASLGEGGVARGWPPGGGGRWGERAGNNTRCLCYGCNSFRLAFGEPPSSVSDDRCQESGISENPMNIERHVPPLIFGSSAVAFNLIPDL
jgi:hypothetical protein